MDIIISNEQFGRAYTVFKQALSCPKFIHCFLGKKGEVKTNNCLSCQVGSFREIVESESPVLYGKIHEFSRYNGIIHDHNVFLAEGGSRWRETQIGIELMESLFFCQTALLVLYGLFLANNEVMPLIRPEEAQQKMESVEEIKPVLERMRQINANWCWWIRDCLDHINRYSQYDKIKEIAIIASIFLNKIDRDREKFFADIEKFLETKK